MVDFRKMISPRSQAKLEEIRSELAEPRNNSEMAAWLVGLARELRETGRFKEDETYSYDEWALFRVIPELAVRLDPTLVRMPEEMPRDAEKSDMVTYVATATDARLDEMVASIISNSSFARCRSEMENTRADRIVDMIHLHRGQRCPLSQAANRLAGRPTPGFGDDDRTPLTGSYLVAANPRHDTVLLYSEDMDELERGMRVLTDRLVHDVVGHDEDLDLVRKLLRYKSDKEVQSWTELSVQDFSGNVLARQPLGAEAEPSPGF